MADTTTKILEIQLNYEKAIKGIAEYESQIRAARQEQQKLKDALKEGEIGVEEYDQQMAATKVMIKQLQTEQGVLTKQVQQSVKAQNAAEDSLVQLRAKLSNLTAEYDALSGEMRTGDVGKALQDQINEVTDTLKGAEEDTQRYYRNVGNYENSVRAALQGMNEEIKKAQETYDQAVEQQGEMSDAAQEAKQHLEGLQYVMDFTADSANKMYSSIVPFGDKLIPLLSKGLTGVKEAFGLAAQGAQVLAKQFIALMANPIVAFLALVAASIATLSAGIKGSEENMDRWQRLMAPLQRGLAAIQSVIETLCGWILSFAEGIGFLAGKVLEFVNIATGGLFNGVIDSANEAIQLTDKEQKLAKDRRAFEVEEAKTQMEIAKLKKEANDTSNKDYASRKKAAQDAANMELKLAEERKRMAREEFEIASARAEWAGNSAKDNEELAKLEAAVYKADLDYYNKTKELQGQINTIDQQAAAEKKKNLDNAKKYKQQEVAAIRQYEDAMLSLVKDSNEKRRKQINNTYDREIEDLKIKLATEKELNAKAHEAINATIKVKEKQRAKDLEDLDKTISSEEISRKQQQIQLMLDAVKSGTDQEYQLKLQQNQLAMEAELQRTEMEIQNTEEREQMKALIRAKYAEQEDQMITQRNEVLREREQQAVQNQFTERLMQHENNELEYAQIELEQRQADLDSLHQMEGETNEAFRARELQALQNFNAAKKKLTQTEIKIEQSKLDAAKIVTGGIADAFETLGEENQAFAKMSKVLALAEIAINTGKAIAAGTAQAQSVPYPGNLVAIATTVATVLANVASAISTVQSAKLARGGKAGEDGYATGGKVRGAGTSTSDSIPAMLSNGEFVMNAASTRIYEPLLRSMNEIGLGITPQLSQPMSMSSASPDLLKESLAASVAEIRPVVSVVDINDGQNRVEVIDALDTI